MSRQNLVLLNALGLVGISGVLLLAFVDQLLFQELPCPLCLLQRAAFVLAGFGLAMNLRFGPSTRHYALVLVAALMGMVVAGRQVLLHVTPGSGSFGAPFLGLHLYTWAFVLFGVTILGIALLLFLHRACDERCAETVDDLSDLDHRVVWLALGAFWVFAALALLNGVSTLLECALGLCADNPVAYQLLP
ncbi:MAG: disulfide bond formation protein B [Halothiobacillaceae bacterium]